MALATVQEYLELPAGVATKAIRVRMRLVALDDLELNGAAYATAAPATVLGEWSTTPNGAGLYQFANVRPNSGASDDAIKTPSGTVYELTVTMPGWALEPRYISVPDSAGPHDVADILSAAPSGLATPSSHQALTDTASSGHPASVITLTSVAGLAAAQGQAAVAELAGLAWKRTPAGARVAATGDSNCVGYAAPTSNITGRPVEQSWFTQAIYASGGRLQWAGNFAVASTTTAHLDGQLDNALATDAGIVVISHGTNDLNVAGLTVAQSAANILAGIERVRAAGRVPWLVTPPPRSDAAADDHVAGLAAWERDYAARNPDVIFTDLHRALADATTGGLASGLGVAESPTIHLTPEGARVAAARMLADIEPRLPTGSAVKLPRSKAEPDDLLAGAGVATALTSNVPTGWTAMAGAEHTGNTATSLAAADSWDPIPGSWYRVAKTASTALSGAFYTLSTSLWDPGEEVELVGRVRISADLTGGQARVYLFGSPSGAFGYYLQPVWELNGECDWTFTIRGTIPATVTSLLIRREVNLLSGASEITGTVDFGPVAVWNRTTADWEDIG